MTAHVSVSEVVALVTTVLGALVVIAYLIKRPDFTFATQVWLFVGLGVLPIATALAGNVAGMEATKSVTFCGSCHVMRAHTGDALDPHSQSLAARHARNEAFGAEACYTCHADYGMFGAVFTKINGLHHVSEYLKEYRKRSLDEALPELALYRPFPNTNCMQCHSTTNRLWLDVNDHGSALRDVQTGKVSCASEGCHGFAHPFSKAAREAEKRRAAGALPTTTGRAQEAP